MVLGRLLDMGGGGWGIASGLHHDEASVFPAAQSQQYMWRARLQHKLVGVRQSHYSQGMYM